MTQGSAPVERDSEERFGSTFILTGILLSNNFVQITV